MFNHLLSRHKRGLLVAATLCSALALSACGGSDNDDKPNTPPPPVGGTPPPPAAGDSFFAYVMSLVGSLADNTEPVVIDAIVETKPENTEPEPVN